MECTDEYVKTFMYKNFSEAKNVKYSISILLLVLIAASTGNHSINQKSINPSPDTIFYRMDTTIKKLEDNIWKGALIFFKKNKKKIKKYRTYIAIDETYDSYTGNILKKRNLTESDKNAIEYIHKYKPKKGDTGSYKYLVFALIYGETRRVLSIKAIKRKENYKEFIVKTLLKIRENISYDCVLFDRGFYDGKFIKRLEEEKIPFIIRARISKHMRTKLGIFDKWKSYSDFEIAHLKIKSSLILGIEHNKGKQRKWAFITNIKFKRLKDVREIYKKRWNIENIFKATDGIQLRAQTSNPITRLFCVCLSFLFYNAWQEKTRTKKINKINFIAFIERIFEQLLKIISKKIEDWRTRIKINILCWNKIIGLS